MAIGHPNGKYVGLYLQKCDRWSKFWRVKLGFRSHKERMKCCQAISSTNGNWKYLYLRNRSWGQNSNEKWHYDPIAEADRTVCTIDQKQCGFYSTTVNIVIFSFYRAMHYSAKRSLAIACRPSVCLSVCHSVCLFVTSVDQDHISWKSWKLIARIISLTSSLFVAQRPIHLLPGEQGEIWGD